MRALRTLALAATLLATVTMAGRPKHYELNGYTFERYVRDFRKRYTTTVERAERQALFEQTLAQVQAHNAGQHSWKMGINHLSDRTPEELKRMRGTKIASHMAAGKVPPPERHYNAKGTFTPRSVDWRDAKPSVLTAVKDQGNCGSCWAHAATEQIESYTALSTGDLYVLSQQQVTACTPNPDFCGGDGGCGGATYELAWEYIKSTGIQQEWTYGYTAGSGQTGVCKFNDKWTVANVSGYTHVAKNDLQALQEALATVGPIAIAVDASSWNTYESGIFAGCDYRNNVSIDHAVQAVGYGTDDAQGLDYWIVRNSWNAGWGENGYIRLLKDTSNPQCGWNVDPADGIGCKGQTAPQRACGMCAIGFDPAYPNVA